jgi:hypothetical protein
VLLSYCGSGRFGCLASIASKAFRVLRKHERLCYPEGTSVRSRQVNLQEQSYYSHERASNMSKGTKKPCNSNYRNAEWNSPTMPTPQQVTRRKAHREGSRREQKQNGNRKGETAAASSSSSIDVQKSIKTTVKTSSASSRGLPPYSSWREPSGKHRHRGIRVYHVWGAQEAGAPWPPHCG